LGDEPGGRGRGRHADLDLSIRRSVLRHGREINPESNEFEPTGPLSIALFVVALANMWINFALSVKRLHDRDRTGWWLLVLYLVIIVAVLLGVVTLSLPEGQRQPLEGAAVGVVMATSVLMLWLVIEIGFLKGTQGPNRYGPDPLAKVHADAKF
jgi:uncharacterized membrane protein YhaH (DUF805 family)